MFLYADINDKNIPLFFARNKILKEYSDCIINPKTREFPDNFTEDTIGILDLENKYTGIALNEMNFLGIDFRPVCVCQENLPEKNCVMFVLKQDKYTSKFISEALFEVLGEPDWMLEFTDDDEAMLTYFSLSNINVSVTKEGYIVFDQYIGDIVSKIMQETNKYPFSLDDFSVFGSFYRIGESLSSVESKLKKNDIPYNTTIDDEVTFLLPLEMISFKDSVFFPRFSFLEDQLVSMELFYVPIIPTMDFNSAAGFESIYLMRRFRDDEPESAFEIEGSSVVYSAESRLYLYAPYAPVEEGLYALIITDKYTDSFAESVDDFFLDYRHSKNEDAGDGDNI